MIVSPFIVHLDGWLLPPSVSHQLWGETEGGLDRLLSEFQEELSAFVRSSAIHCAFRTATCLPLACLPSSQAGESPHYKL